MSVLKVLWTNKSVSLSIDGGKTVSVFSIEDELFYGKDKDYIFDKISRSVRELSYKGFHANVFYEGKNIKHETISTSPEITKKKDIMELIKYKITSKYIVPVFDNYMYSYTLSESNGKERFVIADFFNMDFVQCLVYSFDKLGISLDILSSINPIMSEISKTIVYDKPFIINYITDFGLTDFIYYCKTNGGIASFIRYTPPYENISDIKESIDRSITYGRQLFSGLQPKMFIVGNKEESVLLCDTDYDVEFFGKEDKIWLAIKNIHVNITANVIPQSERGKKEQKNRISAVSLFVLSILASSIFFFIVTDNYSESRRSESLKYVGHESDLSKKLDIFHSITYNKERNSYILSLYADYSLRILNGISGIVDKNIILDSFVSSRENENNAFVVLYTITGYVYENPLDAAEVLSSIENRMKRPPFNAIITESWKSSWLLNIENWKRSGAKSAYKSNNAGISFKISGKIYE